ncbi:hypothetical protein Hypma_008262 [Hypsizygus marmoreus]|uniref:Uncharacterized protein n=1 Tax=Hypsizygus marmoreus TaxID=39966 RepID=A0A369JW72_HYPMA|nr:hypothetical protein Hypma_008262 [Hypsizygus marmoreus]
MFIIQLNSIVHGRLTIWWQMTVGDVLKETYPMAAPSLYTSTSPSLLAPLSPDPHTLMNTMLKRITEQSLMCLLERVQTSRLTMYLYKEEAVTARRWFSDFRAGQWKAIMTS